MQSPQSTSQALRIPALRRLDGENNAFWGDSASAPNERILDLVRLDYTPAPKPNPVSAGLIRLALTVGLAAGGAMYLQAQKQITVADGVTNRVLETFAPTVGEALERSGVKLGFKDRVLPAPGTRLQTGTRVEVLRAKEVTVMVNGQRTVQEVTGRNVEEVLQELSVVTDRALVRPELDSPVTAGDQIVVAQSVQTTVDVDGKARPVTTNVLTAGGLLRQMGVVLGAYDRVEPSILAYPSEGSTIKVVRVNQATETIRSKIPFKTESRPTEELELGIRKASNVGREGVRASNYRIVYEDGKVKSRTLLNTEVVRQPVPEVTLVGTFRPKLKVAKGSQTGGASWYTQPGMMAAHRTLPLGTVVRVTNLANGKQVTVTIRDRGPYVDGRIIDLSDAAFSQLSPQSRGVLNVKIEY